LSFLKREEPESRSDSRPLYPEGYMSIGHEIERKEKGERLKYPKLE
jgi:hypothetical protein